LRELQVKSRWLRTADGFAVCGFGATLARYFEICKGRWLTARLALTRIPGLHLWQTFLNFEGSRDFRPLVSLFFLSCTIGGLGLVRLSPIISYCGRFAAPQESI
jgi:hypothetical protein